MTELDVVFTRPSAITGLTRPSATTGLTRPSATGFFLFGPHVVLKPQSTMGGVVLPGPHLVLKPQSSRACAGKTVAKGAMAVTATKAARMRIFDMTIPMRLSGPAVLG